jgi:hypothetical protein
MRCGDARARRFGPDAAATVVSRSLSLLTSLTCLLGLLQIIRFAARGIGNEPIRNMAAGIGDVGCLFREKARTRRLEMRRVGRGTGGGFEMAGADRDGRRHDSGLELRHGSGNVHDFVVALRIFVLKLQHIFAERPQTTPFDQMRRVQTFPAQQRPELPSRASVRLVEDPALELRGKAPPRGLRCHFRGGACPSSLNVDRKTVSRTLAERGGARQRRSGRRSRSLLLPAEKEERRASNGEARFPGTERTSSGRRISGPRGGAERTRPRAEPHSKLAYCALDAVEDGAKDSQETPVQGGVSAAGGCGGGVAKGETFASPPRRPSAAFLHLTRAGR